MNVPVLRTGSKTQHADKSARPVLDDGDGTISAAHIFYFLYLAVRAVKSVHLIVKVATPR